MKSFAILAILCGFQLGTKCESANSAQSDDSNNCEPLGCSYYIEDNMSKYIKCKSDGTQSTVRFPGDNGCVNWNEYKGIKESFPNDPCCPPEVREAGSAGSATPLIVGGSSVTNDKYAFIASLEGCGGSILRKSSPAMILTAAHCFQAFTKKVELGANKIDDTQNPNVVNAIIKSYIIHPDYDPYETNNDIAILWLETDISSKSQLKEIGAITSISGASECCNDGDDLQVIGYGADLDGKATPTLEFVDVDYMKRATCDTKYGGVGQITNNMICAAASGKDSCQGDSGGPLIKKGTLEQVGIVSFSGGDCADPNIPGVYTDVGKYSQWIQTQKSLTTPPPVLSAQMSVVCDNNGEYSVSQDGGNTYKPLGYPTENPQESSDDTGIKYFWGETIPISKVTANTVLKFECTDTDNVGGLIATVTYKGKEYSTKEGGNFKLTDGTTTGLVYKSASIEPWGDKVIASVASDAGFIWNGQNKNKMVFEFKFANIL